MRKLMIPFFLLVILTLFFSTCKKEDNEPDPAPPVLVGKITAEKSSVKPMEVVMLSTENMQFKNPSYQGSFNGQAIDMNVYENKLVFLVPNLPKGNYNFQVEVEGVSFKTTYIIDSVASIFNADQFIAQHVPIYSFNDTLIDKIVLATKGMYDDFSNQADATMFKQARDDFKAELAKASPETKADFAAFVWANERLFAPLEDVSTAIDSFNVARLSHGSGPEHEIEHFEQQLKARIIILGASAILHLAFNAALLPFPVAKLFISATTTGGLLAQLWLLNNWLIAKLDKSLLAFSVELFGVTRGNYEFEKNEPYSFAVKANYRNLNKDDMGSSSSLVKSIINELNSFETNWLKWMKLLPKSLVGSPYHIKNVTKSKVKKMNVHSDYLAMEIMNNPAVDVDILDADGFVATFKSNSETDQNFSFRIYYEFDQIKNVYQTHQGVLFADKPTPGGCNGVTSVKDLEGNVYPIVQIGNQCWTKENLRSTKYNDGSIIPLIADSVQWIKNYINDETLPMMCWYKNDQTTYTANKFGALYNWYAINPITNGNRNACPAGWHVATDKEWITLIKYLDPNWGGGYEVNIAGGKMKSTGTQYWNSPNTGATNESGFSGLPGGYRHYSGSFYNIGTGALWWSSGYSCRQLLSHKGNSAAIDTMSISNAKAHGFSVRCIRD